LRRYIFILLLLGMPISAIPDTSTEKIKTLMDALGLVDMFSQQIELGRAQNEQIGRQASDQMLSQLNPSEEFRKRFSDATNNYIKKFETPWSAEEIVDIWAGYYGPNFTDKELDQLIEFYTSEIGKKDVSISKQTMTKFGEHLQKVSQPIFEDAITEYIEELKIVARECDCRKVEP
jgi:hypothetical protein